MSLVKITQYLVQNSYDQNRAMSENQLNIAYNTRPCSQKTIREAIKFLHIHEQDIAQPLIG